jgi:hypothetical protein
MVNITIKVSGKDEQFDVDVSLEDKVSEVVQKVLEAKPEFASEPF